MALSSENTLKNFPQILPFPIIIHHCVNGVIPFASPLFTPSITPLLCSYIAWRNTYAYQCVSLVIIFYIWRLSEIIQNYWKISFQSASLSLFVFFRCNSQCGNVAHAEWVTQLTYHGQCPFQPAVNCARLVHSSQQLLPWSIPSRFKDHAPFELSRVRSSLHIQTPLSW